MKIAVLGSNGFVGSSLTKFLFLNKKYLVFPISRNTINLLDNNSVREFLKEHKFDVIINAAATMKDPQLIDDTRNNLGIFLNFYCNSELFKKFINLGSGAEYDRLTNIDKAKEESIFEKMPSDSYGFGQNVKSRLSYHKQGFYNLRIFNCFGRGEIPTRIFPKFLESQKNNLFEIKNDRYFDYFSIQDLCKVVESFILNDHTIKDINCVYLDKIKISQAIDLFSSVNNLKQNQIITSTSNLNYTGCGIKLSSLNIKLLGLRKSFEDYLK